MEKEKAELAAAPKISVQENNLKNNTEKRDIKSNVDKNSDDIIDVGLVDNTEDSDDQQKAKPFLNINTDVANFKR